MSIQGPNQGGVPPTEYQIFKTVLKHCLGIICFPVISFFISKTFIFDGILNLSNVSSNVYSAGVAVVVLHIALGLFIYRAYFDGKPGEKQD